MDEANTKNKIKLKFSLLWEKIRKAAKIVYFEYILAIFKKIKGSKVYDYLKYPIHTKEAFLRYLFGCVLLVVPIFGILACFGYALRSMKGVMEGKPTPPAWADFIGLFLAGVEVVVVMLMYGLVFLVPFSIGLFCVLVISIRWVAILGFVFFFLSSILALSAFFVLPMAFMYMMRKDERLDTALQYDNVLFKIVEMAQSYIKQIIYFWLTCFAGVIIVYLMIKSFFILAVIPIFYLMLVAADAFGRFANTLEVYSEETPMKIGEDTKNNIHLDKTDDLS